MVSVLREHCLSRLLLAFGPKYVTLPTVDTRQRQEASVFSDALCCFEKNENLFVRVKGEINIVWAKGSTYRTHLKAVSKTG